MIIIWSELEPQPWNSTGSQKLSAEARNFTWAWNSTGRVHRKKFDLLVDMKQISDMHSHGNRWCLSADRLTIISWHACNWHTGDVYQAAMVTNEVVDIHADSSARCVLPGCFWGMGGGGGGGIELTVAQEVSHAMNPWCIQSC